MLKFSFIFPGQGSQYTGMGKYFYDNFESSRNIFHKADEVLGFKLSEKIFTGSQDELSETTLTQPSILTVSIAILEAIKERCNLTPYVTAGLSLGEYSSLVCANSLKFEDALLLVQKRANLMANSLKGDGYGMSAVISLSEDKILEVIDKVKEYGKIEIANYNCPDQIVVSGESLALDYADKLFLDAGARKSVRLSVKAPFHSSFLSSAANEYKNELLKVHFNPPSVPIIGNVDGEKMVFESLVELLSMQIRSSVLWEKSVHKMIEMGTDVFVEIGPSKTLTGFMRKIDRKIKVFNIEDEPSFDKFLNFVSEV